jgi:hypothetical protein
MPAFLTNAKLPHLRKGLLFPLAVILVYEACFEHLGSREHSENMRHVFVE